jgi:hypothetical protein
VIGDIGEQGAAPQFDIVWMRTKKKETFPREDQD